MADHSACPQRPASSPTSTLDELLAACREDYASQAHRRAQDHRDDAHLLPDPAPIAQPSELATAIRVGQRMLAVYGTVQQGDIFAYAQAHGGLAEALRILLRALGATPAEQAPVTAERCPAAHPDDPTPCDGPPLVTVLDARKAGAHACEHHGARLLASLEGGGVYALPDAPPGTAIRVFKAAAVTRPFAWLDSREGESR